MFFIVALEINDKNSKKKKKAWFGLERAFE